MAKFFNKCIWQFLINFCFIRRTESSWDADLKTEKQHWM